MGVEETDPNGVRCPEVGSDGDGLEEASLGPNTRDGRQLDHTWISPDGRRFTRGQGENSPSSRLNPAHLCLPAPAPAPAPAPLSHRSRTRTHTRTRTRSRTRSAPAPASTSHLDLLLTSSSPHICRIAGSASSRATSVALSTAAPRAANPRPPIDRGADDDARPWALKSSSARRRPDASSPTHGSRDDVRTGGGCGSCGGPHASAQRPSSGFCNVSRWRQVPKQSQEDAPISRHSAAGVALMLARAEANREAHRGMLFTASGEEHRSSGC